MSPFLQGALVICVLILISSTSSIIVKTQLGEILGNITSLTVGTRNIDIATYLGIPYAEPPVGKLRFAKTVARSNFTETFNALEYGVSCLQVYDIGVTGEDCLYLNIFSPDIHQNGQKFAVLIWIHGGAFIFGSGKWQTFGNLAAHGQIIVVTFNYRLGPFGFLNTGDGAVNANNGLWDQHTAIKWVHDNIASFNGDPNRITIAGNSAGSASVMYQAIYPGNSGLFKRVIAESGSANAPWAIVKNPASKAYNYGKRFGCVDNSASKLVQCLRNENNVTEMSRIPFVTLFDADGMDWSPSIDGDIVTQDMVDILNSPTDKKHLAPFRKLDLIMGTNGFEGQSFIIPPTTTSSEDLKQQVDDMMKSAMTAIYDTNTSNVILEDVLFEYSNYESPLNNTDLIMKKLVDLITDTSFYAPTVSSLLSHVIQNTDFKTYQYEFNELYPLLPQVPWVTGAIHAVEMPYVFGSIYDRLVAANMTEIETKQELSLSVMTYWSNFVKSGNPNLPEKVPVEWKEFTEDKRNYLYLTSAEIKNGENLYARRTAFWLEHFPKLLDRVKREQQERDRIQKEQQEIDRIKKELKERTTQTCGSPKTVNNSIFVTVLVLFVYTNSSF